MEVKHADKCIGLGLYATKSYKTGSVILEESPLWTSIPNSKESLILLRSQFSGIQPDDPKASIESPLYDISFQASDIDSNLWNEARSMLTNAAMLCVKPPPPSDKTRLLNLYYPKNDPNEYEADLIKLSQKVLDIASKQASSDSILSKFLKESPQDLSAVMLICRCNSFKGGLIYERMSRINHSCDFNAVISTEASTLGRIDRCNSDLQIVKAAADINIGDEICISYLGSFTYTGYKMRSERLIKDKFFICNCIRCHRECRAAGTNGMKYDVASGIPCPNCHVRIGRYLDEDDQYDDDGTITYCYPVHHQDGAEYHCSTCGIVDIDDSILEVMHKTIEKASCHLEEGFALQKGMGIDDDEDERNTLLEMTERLSALSRSVLGNQHWTTNLLLLILLGRKLSLLHAAMLCGADEDDKIDTIEIAECIDSLQRIWKYVENLKLKSHAGHLLGNVTIGVSRVLIGMKDLKSMKYGAEWATKVNEGYFACGFEGESSAKVVETLISAWKRQASSVNDDEDQPSKKLKI
jgi:hypothetical protein